MIAFQPKFTQINYKKVSSTQEIARDFISKITQDNWVVIIAQEQTLGRATRDRSWFSPEGVNVYATFVFPFLSQNRQLLKNIPQVMACSVLQTLKSYGLKPRFKWSNDILIDQKKICGILCETEASSNLSSHKIVLAGVGINVNMSQEMLGSLRNPATSIRQELGHSIVISSLLEALIEKATINIQAFFECGFDPFVDEISKNMEYLNQSIQLQLDDERSTIKEGILKGISREGLLLLETKEGIEKFFSGRLILS